MATVIKPTVGRVVWYWPAVGEELRWRDKAQPLSAQVAFVNSDKVVNLQVIDHNGVAYSRVGVPLLQEGDKKPDGGGYCEWMPYQIGQAAKHSEPSAKEPSAK